MIIGGKSDTHLLQYHFVNHGSLNKSRRIEQEIPWWQVNISKILFQVCYIWHRYNMIK